MKMKIMPIIVAAGLLCGALTQTTLAQDIDTIAPVVVKTVPEAGKKDIPPGDFEIKITFSKEMTDQSWSWCMAWKDSTPDSNDKPHYDADKRTCIFKVKLEPNKTYGYWINNQNFHGFADAAGHPAVPYLLVFKTRSQ
jgi:hypothetical protein